MVCRTIVVKPVCLDVEPSRHHRLYTSQAEHPQYHYKNGSLSSKFGGFLGGGATPQILHNISASCHIFQAVTRDSQRGSAIKGMIPRRFRSSDRHGDDFGHHLVGIRRGARATAHSDSLDVTGQISRKATGMGTSN